MCLSRNLISLVIYSEPMFPARVVNQRVGNECVVLVSALLSNIPK
jgi:hypothetical protein